MNIRLAAARLGKSARVIEAAHNKVYDVEKSIFVGAFRAGEKIDNSFTTPRGRGAHALRNTAAVIEIPGDSRSRVTFR